ncbi:PaaI family thioesterase [Halomarina halobia]|uniref:PaaI family thioesterase n=1 Tax=Halomarina halobia TaxID=3033386 RepID=A0ABD6A615_9EURY|nr:PaaI family thioesterase [Halomarina sp. PSR21]
MSADADCDADGDTDADADSKVDADAIERHLRRGVDEYGLFRWLDLDFEVLEPGRVAMSVPFDEKFVNLTGRTIHGGITAALIDTASGFALRSTFERPEAASLTTTDLNVRYVRPARDDVRAAAEVVRAGRSMGVTEVTVTSTTPDGEERTVATGGTTYRIFRGEGDE